MTDGELELLLFAAKAAGIKIHKDKDYLEDDAYVCNRMEQTRILFHGKNRLHPMCREDDGARNILWNPLICDDDAFRLAVKLEIIVTRHEFDGYTFSRDTLKDTRLAIVREAAKIGEAMP